MANSSVVIGSQIEDHPLVENSSQDSRDASASSFSPRASQSRVLETLVSAAVVRLLAAQEWSNLTTSHKFMGALQFLAASLGNAVPVSLTLGGIKGAPSRTPAAIPSRDRRHGPGCIGFPGSKGGPKG